VLHGFGGLRGLGRHDVSPLRWIHHR
jgi:hypothetical protein